MYRDSKRDKIAYLKMLAEANANMDTLEKRSNPALDIYNWDGKGEMPTTIATKDMDDIIEKIAGKKLNKTEMFETAYNQIFGKDNAKGYSPYDSLEDYSFRDSFLEHELGQVPSNKSSKYNEIQLVEKADEDEDDDDDKNMDGDSIDMDVKNLKDSEIDDDDDEDDDDDSLKETFMGLNLDEDAELTDEQIETILEGLDDDEINSIVESIEKEDAINKSLSENVKVEKSPISLLENTEVGLDNIASLLEQTQLIEDESESVLSYDFNDSSDFSDTITESELADMDDDSDMFLESFDDMDDDFLDEDI